MSKLRLTYSVTWQDSRGQKSVTEVAVRASTNAEGRKLAEDAARTLMNGAGANFTAGAGPSRMDTRG